MSESAQSILDFWLVTVGPKGWYMPPKGLDDTIRHRFEPLWRDAVEGGLREWCANAQGALAYLILTDQFPRNMFRDQAGAFATDALALDAAGRAITADLDLQIAPPQQQFFYMPFMHSENLSDQDRGVFLFETRMRDDAGNALHAQAHREIIRRFGRFPYRNAALGRKMTTAEQQFIDQGGYGAVLNALRDAKS